MINKFDNLINDTFAQLVLEVEAGISPEEAAQNPDLVIQQQADTIKATGGPKSSADREVLKKAEQLTKKAPGKSATALAAVQDAEQAQKKVDIQQQKLQGK